MTISLTCSSCGLVLSAEDLDALVPAVQSHVDEHAAARGGGRHVITREQLAARAVRASTSSGADPSS